LRLFRWSLFPRDTKFGILLQQAAENVLKMAREFRELVLAWDNVKQRVDILTDLERDGDAITHQVMSLLHRTFITPFDREDIGLLAESLDDIADRIHNAADMMLVYKVERPTDRAKELVDIVFQITSQVENAVSGIGGRIDHNVLLRQCVEINRLENLADVVYRAALVDLFGNPADIPYLVKWREIYEVMESTADSCESTANILEGMALKYT